MSSPTARTLAECRICEYPGCGRQLMLRNKSGYCKPHHGFSPHRRQRLAEYYKKNREAILQQSHERREYKTRYRYDRSCVVDGCEKIIRSDNKSGLCRYHARRLWAKENYNPLVAANQRLRQVYGVDLATKVDMLEMQGGLCSICETDTPGRRGWCLDHNHETGEIRGVLCGTCNIGLGYFKDSPRILLRAIGYLQKKRHDAKKVVRAKSHSPDTGAVPKTR